MAAFVSIVTVVLNNARGLRLTAKSLSLQQDAPEIEWIVIDGASTDDTKQIAEENKDIMTHFISEPDGGIYDAMNKGLALATGDYVWFLNGGACLADAYTLRDLKRESVVTLKPDLLYGDVREGGHIRRARDFHTLNRAPITHYQGILYRMKAVDGARFDRRYNVSADYAFTLDVASRAKRTHHFPRIFSDFKPKRLMQTELTERFIIRRDVLRQSSWKNKFHYLWEKAEFKLRKRLARR